MRQIPIVRRYPFYYFGAEVIADAFPEARFLAPTKVIERIARSFEGKLKKGHISATICQRGSFRWLS